MIEYHLNDRAIKSSIPKNGGNIGFYCAAAGNPGTWFSFTGTVIPGMKINDNTPPSQDRFKFDANYVLTANYGTAFFKNNAWFDANGRNFGPKFGNTSSRPTNLTSADVGYPYFDTTLGKPIYWAGASWVDATGATV